MFRNVFGDTTEIFYLFFYDDIYLKQKERFGNGLTT
jgi:hypothetical protein